MNKLRSIWSRFMKRKAKKKEVEEDDVQKVSPVTEPLCKVATKCLSYPLDRSSRLKGKINGLVLLQKLVKKIEKEKLILTDTDLRLLLRCSLHTHRYFSQKACRGLQYLMKDWLDDAEFCVEKSVSAIDRGQIQVAIYYLLRFFHDEDRWHSFDTAMRVFKDLMQKMGEKYIENVEEDILSMFLNHMALFCPGTAIGPSLKIYPYPDDPNKLKNVPIKKNPIPPLSRILHVMLHKHQFKSMDNRIWVILDTLFNVYINVVKTCEHVRIHPKQTQEAKRIWREWDSIESAVLGSLRSIMDCIIFYDLQCKNQEITPKPIRKSRRMQKRRKEPEMAFGKGEALAKIMSFVLDHALDTEIPLSARNNLLDMLINATETPPPTRSLSLCLPEEVLDQIIQIAMSGDPGSAMRSNNLLHNLLNRHSFKAHFQAPRIFTERVNEFEIENNDPEDWEYMKEHQKSIYSMLFLNFLSQNNNQINLEALYCTLCLLLVEMQNLYLARDIAELMVNIQDLVITNPDMTIRSPRITSWIHGIVISILSLIVLLFDMKDLRKEIFEVAHRRSQVAPFLLPPLKVIHSIGDVTEFQDDVFFSYALVRRHFNISLAKQAEETELTEEDDVPEQSEETEQDVVPEETDVTRQNEITEQAEATNITQNIEKAE